MDQACFSDSSCNEHEPNAKRSNENARLQSSSNSFIVYRSDWISDGNSI